MSAPIPNFNRDYGYLVDGEFSHGPYTELIGLIHTGITGVFGCFAL